MTISKRSLAAILVATIAVGIALGTVGTHVYYAYTVLHGWFDTGQKVAHRLTDIGDKLAQHAPTPDVEDESDDLDADDDETAATRADEDSKAFMRLVLTARVKLGDPTGVLEQTLCGRRPLCTSQTCKANLARFRVAEKRDGNVAFFNSMVDGASAVTDKLVTDEDGPDKIGGELMSLVSGTCSATCDACGLDGQPNCPLSCALCGGDKVKWLKEGRRFVCPTACNFCGGMGGDKPACPIYCSYCGELGDQITAFLRKPATPPPPHEHPPEQ